MSSIYDWSLTASDNGNSDADINFAEGQAPSTLNNSNRQVMARVAELIDDLGSNVTVGGTANAITITANSAVTAYATGQRLVFKAETSNTGATTLNVNSIGTKPIRKIGSAGDADLASGDLLAGSLYEVIYSADLNTGAGGWQLMSPLPVVPVIDPTNYVPTGSGMDFWLPDLPAGYIWADGATLLSDTPYTKLRTALINAGFPNGQDGSGNPKIPDKRGRASVGKDDMGGTDAGVLSTFYGAVARTLGGILGTASHVLTWGQLAKHTPTFTGNPLDPHDHDVGASYVGSGTSSNGGYILPTGTGARTTSNSAGTPSGTISQIGNDEAHPNAQPSIVCNYIIKT